MVYTLQLYASKTGLAVCYVEASFVEHLLVSELTISGSGNKLVYFNTLIFSCK